MHIQFHTRLQCIQISTRINATSVHTYIFSLFYIACIRMFILIDPIFNSHKLYNYSSLPNMIGIPSTEYLEELISESGISHLIGIMLSSNGRLCYKYARELLCHIISPKCYPVKEEVIHPCKETLAEFFEACLENIISVLKKLAFKGSFYGKLPSREDLYKEIGIDYLPSLTGSIPCYYQPVTCKSPPNVLHLRIVNGNQN